MIIRNPGWVGLGLLASLMVTAPLLAEDPTPAEPTPSEAPPTPTPEAGTPAEWPFPNVPMPEAWPLCRTWYPDCDEDGHADPGAGIYTCWNPNLALTPPACRYMRTATDCDDTSALISPNGYEGPDDEQSITDGLDNDCDGFVDIDCDGNSGFAGPRIRIDSPTRGSFTSDAQVEVTGFILPGLGGRELLPMSVGGNPAQMEPCSGDGGVRFSSTVEVEQGLDTITVWVEDVDGKGDEASVSVVRSDTFLNLAAERVSGSLVSLLNQGSWDILGDFLEASLSASELQAELLSQNPLIHDTGSDDCIDDWEIYGEATGYTHDDVEVSFVVTGGVIRTTARLIHPQIWASGWGYYDLEWYCGGWDDTVGMDAYAAFSQVSATADGHLSLDASGQVQVAFTNVNVAVSGANVSVDADDWFYDFLIDLFEDDLEDEMEDFVRDELYSYVANDLGPDLEDELNDLELSYTVDVGDDLYDVDFRYDDVSILEGGVVMGFDMGLVYTPDSRVAPNPGAVHFPTAYTPDVAPTFGFRVGLDFFNAALHSLWEGGSLHLTETLSDEPLIIGGAEPLLPPVIMPSEEYLMELRLADVIGTIEIPLEDGTVYSFQAALSTKVPVSMVAVADGTSLFFDVDFGEAVVDYDLLGWDVLPQEIQDASEEAMGDLLDEVLLEMEGYLEELEISYLGVPMVITDLQLAADVGNPAMIAVDGQATFTGP